MLCSVVKIPLLIVFTKNISSFVRYCRHCTIVEKVLLNKKEFIDNILYAELMHQEGDAIYGKREDKKDGP